MGRTAGRPEIFREYAFIDVYKRQVLDLVLIAGCKMGVAGAAIATDISQLVSCVLALRFLMRVEDDYRVTAKEVRVHKKMAVRIIKVGRPTGIPVSYTHLDVYKRQSGSRWTHWMRTASPTMIPPVCPAFAGRRRR